MPQINYDKVSAEDNMIVKIGNATNINNFSDTSKVKLISRIVSEDINNFVELVNSAMEDNYASSAAGRYLDAKGAENGVYRNTISSISIRDTDLVAVIEPRDSSQTFADFMTRNANIYTGEEVEVGSSFRIVFSKKVTLGPGIENPYISANIEVINKSEGFSINPGDVFKLPDDLLDTSSFLSLVQIRFEKGVSLGSQDESDADFRKKVIFARDNSGVAIGGAIETEIQKVPDIAGYALYTNQRGSGSIDIGITSNVLEQTGSDPSIESSRLMVEMRLRGVVASGVDYEVFVPAPLSLRVEYDYTSEIEIPSSTMQDAFYSALKEKYSYSAQNEILASDIELEVMSILPSLTSVTIDSFALFDNEIEEYIYFGGSSVVAPKGTFITFSKDDIAKVE